LIEGLGIDRPLVVVNLRSVRFPVGAIVGLKSNRLWGHRYLVPVPKTTKYEGKLKKRGGSQARTLEPWL